VVSLTSAKAADDKPTIELKAQKMINNFFIIPPG
jgi:hypothetical protein